MLKLIKAEEVFYNFQTGRLPDKQQAFDEYIRISEMFEHINDFLVAAYFYKKVIAMAKLIKDFPYFVNYINKG